MRRTNLPLCLAALSLGVVAVVLGTRNEPVRAEGPMKTGWEYKVIDQLELARGIDPKVEGFEAYKSSSQTSGLNKLGEDGWEVVGTFSGSVGHPYRYILKRPKR